MFEERRCEGLTNKCSACKKVATRIVKSRVRIITNKCGLQKCLYTNKNSERIVIVAIIAIYVI